MIRAEIDWTRVLQSEPDNPPLILIFPFVIVLASIIAWACTRKIRLKDKMVERGYTPDEIEQVMKAGNRD